MVDRQVVNVAPDLTESQFIRILQDAKSPALSSAHAVYAYCIKRRVSPAFLLALFQHESGFGKAGTATITHSWGNTRMPTHGGVTPVRLTVAGEARSGQFPVFRDWIDGGIATVARMVDYAPYAGKTTVRQIIPIWAPAFDLNNPDVYIAKVLALMAEWGAKAEGATVAVTKATTDRMIRELRARGAEVHDERGKRGNYPQRNSGAYIGVHWTGDNFGKAIPATNTVAEDRKLVEFYRWYHMEGGHGWPGIAYAVLIFPSGRIFVCHDLDRLTYHAFNANDDAVAISFPNSNNATPGERQLRAGFLVLDWLCFDCPELAAGNGQVFGHNEFGFLDSRNTGTSCPGTFLPHVRAYRGRTDRMYPATGGVVETKKEPIKEDVPDGYLEPGQADTFVWPDGAGVVVYRKVRYYNPYENAWFEREWQHDSGFTPWQKVA